MTYPQLRPPLDETQRRGARTAGLVIGVLITLPVAAWLPVANTPNLGESQVALTLALVAGLLTPLCLIGAGFRARAILRRHGVARPNAVAWRAVGTAVAVAVVLDTILVVAGVLFGAIIMVLAYSAPSGGSVIPPEVFVIATVVVVAAVSMLQSVLITGFHARALREGAVATTAPPVPRI